MLLLDGRGITPPPFIAWTLGLWTLVDTVVLGPLPGQWLIILLASGLLLTGARRAARAAPHAEKRYARQ